MRSIILIIFNLFLFITVIQGQTKDTIYKKHCLNVEERKLYLLVNDYRKEKNLPAIKLSKSLSYVAHMHMIDLHDNVKDMTHGWSTCKYDPKDSKTMPCMWLKPSELTEYAGYGYECVFYTTKEPATALDALSAWKKSASHNNVIINKGIWANSKWKALGVGIYKNYAAIWFGEKDDTEEEPLMCNP